MNDKFRLDLNDRLADLEWRRKDTEAVLRRVKGRRHFPLRSALVLAAVIAVLLALAGIGYADYHSGILERLFVGREIRQDAKELVVHEPISLTREGITVTVTEYIYDGQTLHIAGEMRNDTDHELLCGMGGQIGGSSDGVFGLNSGNLVMIGPGGKADGWLEISDMGFWQGLALLWRMQIRAVALKPDGEVQPDVNDTAYYSTERYYGTDRTEMVFEETLTFSFRRNWAGAHTIPGVKKIPMEAYGYTLVMREADFAAVSSKVEFEIIPDNPEDILAYGEEGSGGHERLYRHYEILDRQGERLFAGLTGGMSFGWNANQTRLRYSFDFAPLETIPEEMILVPLSDDGEYLMDEKVVVPVSSAK